MGVSCSGSAATRVYEDVYNVMVALVSAGWSIDIDNRDCVRVDVLSKNMSVLGQRDFGATGVVNNRSRCKVHV